MSRQSPDANNNVIILGSKHNKFLFVFDFDNMYHFSNYIFKILSLLFCKLAT